MYISIYIYIRYIAVAAWNQENQPEVQNIDISLSSPEEWGKQKSPNSNRERETSQTSEHLTIYIYIHLSQVQTYKHTHKPTKQQTQIQTQTKRVYAFIHGICLKVCHDEADDQSSHLWSLADQSCFFFFFGGGIWCSEKQTWRCLKKKCTLQGTNISPKNGILKMIFPTSPGGICIHSLEGIS